MVIGEMKQEQEVFEGPLLLKLEAVGSPTLWASWHLDLQPYLCLHLLSSSCSCRTQSQLLFSLLQRNCSAKVKNLPVAKSHGELCFRLTSWWLLCSGTSYVPWLSQFHPFLSLCRFCVLYFLSSCVTPWGSVLCASLSLGCLRWSPVQWWPTGLCHLFWPLAKLHFQLFVVPQI